MNVQQLQARESIPDDQEAILTTVMDHFDGFVWSIDRSYRSLYRNARLRNIMASLYGVDDSSNERIFEFLETIDPKLARRWEKLYKLAFKGAAQRVLYEFTHGTDPVILELSINPVFTGRRVTSLACFARDVTAEQLNEREIQTVKNRFRVLIEKSHDGICLFEKNGKLRYASNSVFRIMGYTLQELVGKFLNDYIHPKDWPKIKADLMELATKEGESRELICRVKHANGQWRWICSQVTNMLHEAHINAFVLNYSDQTDRILTEKAVANSESLYRSLFNYSPMPIWVCDKKDLSYLEVNNTAIATYGYSRDEFLSMTAFDMRSSNNRQDLERIVEQGVCETFRNRLRRHIKKNGEIIFSEVTVQEINFNDKAAYLVMANDITETLHVQHKLMKERVNRQIDITRATIEAQEKERNEVGIELHDNVNQMLATAKLYVAAADKENGKQNQHLKKSLEILDGSINEIRKICRSLAPPSLGNVTLKESLQALIMPLGLTDKHIRLYINNIVEEDLSHALKVSIYRIVQEQLNNILKHSAATNVIISLQRCNNQLELKIADNGVGFDPAKKGTGIGLSNIQNRSSTFNGKVNIESSPGHGCRLFVSFAL